MSFAAVPVIPNPPSGDVPINTRDSSAFEREFGSSNFTLDPYHMSLRYETYGREKMDKWKMFTIFYEHDWQRRKAKDDIATWWAEAAMRSGVRTKSRNFLSDKDMDKILKVLKSRDEL